MRLGIFGGTFDPVHLGHLILAEQCAEQCQLDEVWFMPTNLPPHKRDAAITPGKQRVEMLEFAIAGRPGFSVSKRELERTGVSYTVETLQQLHEEDPTREFFFLIGGDSLADLPTWREPERILSLATIVAVNRGDLPLADLAPLAEKIGPLASNRIRQVNMPGVHISSTDLRQRVRDGRSIRYLTPRAVEVYIHENRLYSGVSH